LVEIFVPPLVVLVVLVLYKLIEKWLAIRGNY